jgi:hypothetical protein
MTTIESILLCIVAINTSITLWVAQSALEKIKDVRHDLVGKR